MNNNNTQLLKSIQSITYSKPSTSGGMIDYLVNFQALVYSYFLRRK